MPPPYCYQYPRPAVTVDLVVFALDEGALRALLIRRKRDPFAGAWAIPGGFLEIDEPAEAAARRELAEETTLDHQGPIASIGTFSAPGRDPRGRTISLAFATVVRAPLPAVGGADDAAEACWADPRGDLPLAFDHAEIMTAALDWLAREVAEGWAGLEILPRQFGDQDLKDLFHAIGKTNRQATAWRDRLLRAGRIEAVPRRAGRYRAKTR